MSDEDIDKVLLSTIGSDWAKAGLMVGWTGYNFGIRYWEVARRVEALVAQGRLLCDGDLSSGRGWIEARIRRSN